MEDSLSPASLVLMAGSCLASLAALLYLFQKHIAGLPLLDYEPRFRVPWGGGIAFVAMLFPFMGILAILTSVAPETTEQAIVEQQATEIVEDDQPAQAEDTSDFVINGLSTSVLMIAFVVVVSLFLRSSVGADNHDLGLPRDSIELVHDVTAGAVACAAAMLPIYVVQFLLTILLQPVNEHPLIDDLQQTHTPAMMIVGLLMVVIAAPLSEEFAFRLLLQGWLEKFEDQLMGFTATLRPVPVVPQENQPDELAHQAGDEEPPMDERDVIPLPFEPAALPREGLLPGLPHGWLPILASGTIFGLAHLGHGVSPIPLVLFGIVLGYLYQRTHRLVPSITAHALFNAYSMTMLWLNLK